MHARTSRYGGSRANPNTACPACGMEVESLPHLMFECPATSSLRDSILTKIRGLPDCAEKLRSVLSLSDAAAKVLRFVSDDVWGSVEVGMLVSRFIADYLVQAWDVRNNCKQHGAVLLPPPSALVGRGADGIGAMA